MKSQHWNLVRILLYAISVGSSFSPLVLTLLGNGDRATTQSLTFLILICVAGAQITAALIHLALRSEQRQNLTLRLQGANREALEALIETIGLDAIVEVQDLNQPTAPTRRQPVLLLAGSKREADRAAISQPWLTRARYICKPEDIRGIRQGTAFLYRVGHWGLNPLVGNELLDLNFPDWRSSPEINFNISDTLQSSIFRALTQVPEPIEPAQSAQSCRNCAYFVVGSPSICNAFHKPRSFGVAADDCPDWRSH